MRVWSGDFRDGVDWVAVAVCGLGLPVSWNFGSASQQVCARGLINKQVTCLQLLNQLGAVAKWITKFECPCAGERLALYDLNAFFFKSSAP